MPFRCLFTIAALSTLLSLQSASGWEIHLRATFDCSKSLVTLGDLAELRSLGESERERLSAIELFSAPPQGRPVSVRRGDLRDMLALRSVNLIGCLLTGAESTTVRSIPREEGATSPENRGQGNPSQSDSQGHSTETLQAGYNNPVQGEPQSQALSEQTYVAVTNRLIQRGEIIRADDITMMLPADNARREGLVSSLDDVIGREAMQSLSAGRAIERRMIRKPLLVHRGEIVAVVARAGGVQIRTSARVMDDGSEGDLVKMQTPDRQSEYLARVIGIQEVEVYVAVANANQRERR